MSALTFTPGKFYKTRDGQKREVVLTGRDFGNGYTMLVIATRPEGTEYTSTHASNGCFWSHDEGHPADLIAEWVDAPEVDWSKMPAWAVAVAKQKQGSWLWFSASPVEAGVCWICPNGSSGLIPAAYCPKWSGDWRDSLVTREGAQP